MEEAAGLGAVLALLFGLGILGLGLALLLAPLMIVRRLGEIRRVLLRLTLAVEADKALEAEERQPVGRPLHEEAPVRR